MNERDSRFWKAMLNLESDIEVDALWPLLAPREGGHESSDVEIPLTAVGLGAAAPGARAHLSTHDEGANS